MECKARSELKKQGMDNKKITKYKDLIALKGVGGPFTSAEDVDMYLQLEDMNKISNLACTLNSDYARATSLSLPKSSDVFSLLKDHRKLKKTVSDIV